MFSVESAKKSFFDSKAVIGATDAATRKVLAKQGALVRRQARSLIRRRKGPAPPGEPPHSHKGQLRKFLFFAYDRQAKSVVVGPAALGRATAPALLEYGGTFRPPTKKNSKAKPKQIHIAQRPYMSVALEQTKDKLPKTWKDAIR